MRVHLLIWLDLEMISSRLLKCQFSSENKRQNLKGTEYASGSFEISHSASYLKDLPIDDIFEDAVTSGFDSDFACPSTTPTVYSRM